MRHRNESGRLLVEAAVAAGIGAAALLGLVSLLPVAFKTSHLADERNLARRAAEQRLVEIATMDAPTFRAALAAGPTATALVFDVAGLKPVAAGAHVGLVIVAPAPGTPDFDQASLFQLKADCRWAGAGGGDGSLRISTLFAPEGGP